MVDRDLISSKSRIWSGEPRNFFLRFYRCSKVELGEQSEPLLARGQGCLRTLEAFAFLIVKYAFSHFFLVLFSNFLMYICVGILQNIYFKIKDSANCDKCNIPLICSFGLVCRHISQ